MNSWQVSCPVSISGVHRVKNERTACVYTSSLISTGYTAPGYQGTPRTFAIQRHLSCGIPNQPIADWNTPFDDFSPDVFLKDFRNVDTSEYNNLNKIQPIDLPIAIYTGQSMTNIKPSRQPFSPTPVSIFSSRFGCPSPSQCETETLSQPQGLGPNLAGVPDPSWEKLPDVERKHVIQDFPNDIVSFPLNGESLGDGEIMANVYLNGKEEFSSETRTRNIAQPFDYNGDVAVVFGQVPQVMTQMPVDILQSAGQHCPQLQDQENPGLGISSNQTYGNKDGNMHLGIAVKKERLEEGYPRAFERQEVSSVKRFLKRDVPFAPTSDLYETTSIKRRTPPLSEVQTNSDVQAMAEGYQIDSLPEIASLLSPLANKDGTGNSREHGCPGDECESSAATQEWSQNAVAAWKETGHGEMGFLEDMSSPRVHSSNSSSITPSTGEKAGKDNCIYGRADNEPRRPKNGFIRFSIENRHKIAADHPKLDNRDVSKLLGCKWRKMRVDEKKQYEEEFQRDIKTIRNKNPEWCYAPAKKLAEIEPMPSRLRPRHSLKRIPVEMLPQRRHSARSRGKKRAKMEVIGPTTWQQCRLCSKWRCLPRYILPENQSKEFCCECRYDNRQSSSFYKRQENDNLDTSSCSPTTTEKEVHLPVPSRPSTECEHVRIPWSKSNSPPLASSCITRSDSNAHVLLREPSW